MESLVDQSCNLSDIQHGDAFHAKSPQTNMDYTQDGKQGVHDHGGHYYPHMQGLWIIVWLMFMEYAALWVQGEKLPGFHHNLLSLCYAVTYQITRIVFRGFEFAFYVWVWENYALFSLSSDSAITVVGVALLTDLAYYWFHRAAHEIAIFWAIHQVHHSSDDITVTVGLRHSPLQKLFAWVFYLPLAVLGVPPAHMVAQEHFNKMYQCWIHTDAIKKLGPLEYIFNTPSHHRVHHGSNFDYLDTNYGGIFIIWDHMFGTFKAENPEEKTIYNLLVTPEFLEPIYNQTFYVQYITEKAAGMSNWWDYLCTFIKGPSWKPGSKWTGNREDVIKVDPNRPLHGVQCGWILHAYTLSHFLSALILTTCLDVPKADGFLGVLLYCVMVVATLSSIGRLYDNSPQARPFEVFRCFIVICLQILLPADLPELVVNLIFYLHVLSATLWVCLPNTLEI